MKYINPITLLLLIVGGLNWGLVSLFNLDLVAYLFGAGTTLAHIVYLTVALSAVYQIYALVAMFRTPDTIRAQYNAAA